MTTTPPPATDSPAGEAGSDISAEPDWQPVTRPNPDRWSS